MNDLSQICSKCKYEDINELDSPCIECFEAFFDDWKNPKRKFGKYFSKKLKNDMKGNKDEQKQNT